MSVLAVVQARMSSSRLPGKVLADIAGEPMLALVLARLRRATGVDGIVVATSDLPSDDPVAAAAAAAGARVARGPLEDVLHRFVLAIGDHDGTVVRITADCPLTDPALVDAVVAARERTPGCRYASNIEPRSFPKGLDVEAVDAAVLRELDRAVTDPELREHVTLAVRRDLDRYGAAAVVGDEDLGELWWTVDTADDLEFVRAVAARLGARAHDAGWEEILPVARAIAGADRRPGSPIRG